MKPVAVKETDKVEPVELNPATEADSVLAPAVEPSVQFPEVAMPDPFVTEVIEVAGGGKSGFAIAPDPPVTANETLTPERSVDPSFTITEGATGNTVFVEAACWLPASKVIVGFAA